MRLVVWLLGVAVAQGQGDDEGTAEIWGLAKGRAAERAQRARRYVEEAKSAQTSDPTLALERGQAAKQLLGKGRPKVREGQSPSKRALLWARAHVEIGAASRTMIRHEEAAAAYGEALRVLEAAPRGTKDEDGRPLEMEIMATKMERGWALSKARRHAEAIAESAALRGYAPPGEGDRRHFETTVLLEESRLFWCAGREAEAVSALEGGLGLRGGGLGPAAGSGVGVLDAGWLPDPDTAQQAAAKLNDLLQLYRWAGREKEAQATATAAARLGGWPSKNQRPTNVHIRALSGASGNRPWPEPSAFPSVAGFMQALEARTAALRAEYAALQADGRLEPQTECLHDPRGGEWRYFPSLGDGSVGGMHDPSAPSCSQHSPEACALAQLAATAGVEVLRLGYSVLEPEGWIRPHVGHTNAQLKIHLGLVVPGEGCSTFAIDGDERGWEEGKAILFDDSFEHEVRNRCGTSRAVLQVVIRHPSLRHDREL